MTDTLEATDIEDSELEIPEDGNTEPGEDGDETEAVTRDYTKVNDKQIAVTEFVNAGLAEAGLDQITAFQFKAIVALRTDYNKQPEIVAERTAASEKRAALNAKYEGLTPEQKKAAKDADKAQARAEKYQKEAAEALARAEALKNAATGSAADLAASVESAVESEPETPEDEIVAETPRPKVSRRR